MMIRRGIGVVDETGADPLAELQHLLAAQAAASATVATPSGMEEVARTTGWQQMAYLSQQIYNWLLALRASSAGLNSTQSAYLDRTINQWASSLAQKKAGAAAEVAQYGQAIADAGARLIAKDIAPGNDTHTLSWNIEDVKRGILAILGAYVDPSVKTSADAAAAQQAAWIEAEGAAARAAIADGTYYSRLSVPLQFIPKQFGGTMPDATPPPVNTIGSPVTQQQQVSTSPLSQQIGNTGIPMYAAIGGGFLLLMMMMGGGRR